MNGAASPQPQELDRVKTSVGTFTISSDNHRMDLTAIHQFLTQSYWSKGIPIETVAAAIEGSICYGVFSSCGRQVGFARLVTDKVTIAHLCDVFIVEEFRGCGLGSRLISAIFSEPWVSRLRRVTLATRDAHDLYRGFGFGPLSALDTLMEVTRPPFYGE